MKTGMSGAEPIKRMKRNHRLVMVAAGLLPSTVALGLWQLGVSMGTDYPAGSQVTDYPHDLAAFVMFNTLICAAAVSVSVLCFLQFKETGRIVKPLLALPLLVGGLLELVRVMALIGWLPNAAPMTTFIPVSRILADGLMTTYLCLLPTIFIAFDTIRGQERKDRATAWATGITIVLVAFSLWIFHYLTQLASTPGWVLEGPFSRHFFRWLPLGLVIFLGVFVLPTYVRVHPSIFVESVWIACLPLGLAVLQFALMGDAGWGWNYITANAAKLAAFLLPAFGLVLEYRLTHRALRENNRMMQDQLFLSSQLNENVRNQERYLGHIMKHIDLPLCILDASRRVVMINDTALQAASIAKGTAVTGKTIEAIFPSSFAAPMTKAAQAAQTQPDTAAISETCTAGGRTFHWSFSAFTDAQGKVIGAIGVGKETARV